MDASLAGYFAILPLLFSAFRRWIPGLAFRRILHCYHLVFILAAALLYIADLEIFRLWGHHADGAILPYLAFPAEALASTLSAPWHLLLPLWLIFSAIWILLWMLSIRHLNHLPTPPARAFFPALLLAASCILPIRGGLQLAPMNQSSVYFSNKRILNQAAENPIWVFGQSLIENPLEKTGKLYSIGNPEEGKALYDSLYGNGGFARPVLSNTRPNIVLIIWESLSAKVAGCCGGKFPSTPNLDRLAASGLLFSGMYANGDRSDKGLVSILSAQPAFGQISLMSHPNLSANFDFLNRRLQKTGYASQYFYGGELEFANMKSYLLNAGFNKLTGKDSFPPESWNSKWGAHDELLFSRQLREPHRKNRPFSTRFLPCQATSLLKFLEWKISRSPRRIHFFAVPTAIPTAAWVTG